MANLQSQLENISKSIATLTKKVDRLADQLKAAGPPKKKTEKSAAPKKKTEKKKSPAQRAVKKTAAKAQTLLDSVYEVVKKSKNGVAIATIKAKTNLDPRQLSNALYKLTKRGKIHTKTRGHYVKK